MQAGGTDSPAAPLERGVGATPHRVHLQETGTHGQDELVPVLAAVLVQHAVQIDSGLCQVFAPPVIAASLADGGALFRIGGGNHTQHQLIDAVRTVQIEQGLLVGAGGEIVFSPPTVHIALTDSGRIDVDVRRMHHKAQGVLGPQRPFFTGQAVGILEPGAGHRPDVAYRRPLLGIGLHHHLIGAGLIEMHVEHRCPATVAFQGGMPEQLLSGFRIDDGDAEAVRHHPGKRYGPRKIHSA